MKVVCLGIILVKNYGRKTLASPKTILVTGGAGFIGSALIRRLIQDTNFQVINVDKLTYAGNLDSLAEVNTHPNYQFEQQDIGDMSAMQEIFAKYKPDAVMHLAAESHVDRSIDGPSDFIQTNILGTYTLLEVTKSYYLAQERDFQNNFRFLHISTDEVYGSLGPQGLFSETTPYDPRSPYSASKASSDHLVAAWHHTYNLPILITNCSNNYGPYQFPEKLIPTVILKAIAGETIPVYGQGDNVRDWLYVDDHVRGLVTVLEKGTIGETYNIGTNNEKTNLQIINAICSLLDELIETPKIKEHKTLISFVKDRPGHDKRYAIDASKIKQELNWQPQESFETGLRKTVMWYLENKSWWQRVLSGDYRLERLGLKEAV